VKISPLLLKVIVWRVLSIMITAFVMFAFTGSIASAGSLTVALHIVLITFHYIFEKVWEKVVVSSNDHS
tara:strand:- start:466 stop:672 length:207 start_codon:yes stop_codon:yes gene_type:complete